MMDNANIIDTIVAITVLEIFIVIFEVEGTSVTIRVMDVMEMNAMVVVVVVVVVMYMMEGQLMLVVVGIMDV